jgi:hypothetical protein
MLHYHTGWNFALNRQLGDQVFHPSSLVNFRKRLTEHQQSALGFTMILDGLVAAGLVSRQSRQRLDSTQMLGRVARMSRLDCVRESLRLALQELEGTLSVADRPGFWVGLWERYVESQVDYRANAETLGRKLAEAGTDAWQLLEWLGQAKGSPLRVGPQVELLRRVFSEQFEIRAGQSAPASNQPIVLPVSGGTVTSQVLEKAAVPASIQPEAPSAQTANKSPIAQPEIEPEPVKAEVAEPGCGSAPSGSEPDRSCSVAELLQGCPTPGPAVGAGAQVQPKDKKELSSDRVQNPHEPEATYAVKGHGKKKKEHVGYKLQVGETVCEAVLAPGEPTRNFLVGIVTHQAYESDLAGADKMEVEQEAMGLSKPPVQYVDGAYISAEKLAVAAAQGREIIGAAAASASNEGRFTSQAFQVEVEQRRATCPAGHLSTHCICLEVAAGRVIYRFEWDTATCAACPLRNQCIKADHLHRKLAVGEHHTALQTRRQEQCTPAFKERMKHRNGIEGTQSELVRGHGLRHARYRGLAKTKLQSYFTGAACNVKRWLGRVAWEMKETALAGGISAAAGAS